MKEEEILRILRDKNRMEIYYCESDFIKEFCKLSTFFNLQIVSFLISRICEESSLKQRDVSQMVIKAWEKNMDKTVDTTLKGTAEADRERTKKTLDEARRLATNYIKAKLDIPPSAQDLSKMFKDL